MKNSTLCYIEKDNKYLMLYRNKKQSDPNEGKYVGVGGHFEENETPYECAIREVLEETGLILKEPQYRGIVTFVSDKYEDERMHLFTCSDFEGELADCDEGELSWVEKSKIEKLPMWEGDIYFLRMLSTDSDFFTMKLTYEGDALVECLINGVKQKI